MRSTSARVPAQVARPITSISRLPAPPPARPPSALATSRLACLHPSALVNHGMFAIAHHHRPPYARSPVGADVIIDRLQRRDPLAHQQLVVVARDALRGRQPVLALLQLGPRLRREVEHELAAGAAPAAHGVERRDAHQLQRRIGRAPKEADRLRRRRQRRTRSRGETPPPRTPGAPRAAARTRRRTRPAPSSPTGR